MPRFENKNPMFYIDNGVFNKLCTNYEFGVNFDSAISKNPNLPKHNNPLSVPFFLPEAIGLKVKMDPLPVDQSLSNQIKKEEDKIQRCDLIKEYLDKIYEKT